jgi:iron(III) transport system substrate-binding protein
VCAYQTARSASASRTAIAIAGCLALALTACAGKPKSANGDSDSAPIAQGKDLASVCAAGESEGKLSFRDTTDPEIFAKEVAAFEQKYPKIKIDFGSQRPQDSVQRIVTQKQARHAIDVDAISIDMPSTAPLIQQGLIQPVDWSALDVPQTDVVEVQGSRFVRTQRIILGLGYDTTKINPSELPDTWEELIDPKWAGKVIVDPRGQYLSGLGIVWGEEKAVDWYKRFIETDKPMIVKGATASLQKVISGEAELTTSSHDAEVLEQQSKGAKVGIKYLDVVPTQDHYATIVKGAAHPNAAACFLGWWISKDGGQAQQLKYEFKGNEDKPAGMPADAKLGALTSEEDAALQNKVGDQFASLTK